MRYLAAIDYEHLDNALFLTTLARSLSQQQSKNEVRSVILHGDSEYTERIIQTGVMRDEARVRSVKDLNHRLVALFADEGVSAIGINPAHKNVIRRKDGNLHLDHSFLKNLPPEPVLLLSTLVWDDESGQPVVLDLAEVTGFLYDELNMDELIIFSMSDEAEVFTAKGEDLEWETMDDSFREQEIPEEFSQLNRPVRLTSARDFNQIPDLNQAVSIR